ncbi:MAG: 3'-5' exonuclease [Acidobacteria bacterium]|nr:3'-5' exonuclease [Acidobacteriota bacterium]
MSWTDATPVGEVRFVLLDTETTGLDPRKDRIVTMGAIAVVGGEILIEDSFEALVRLPHNSSSVTVHGVTREESQRGVEEAEALQLFREYLKDGVIVGHHIGHDVETLNAGYERHFGFRMENRSLDTMELALNLERDGAFGAAEEMRDFSLDALCARFEVVPHDRHTAPGDAFMTALVFQRLLRLAARSGRATLGRLCEAYEPEASARGECG